MASARGWERYRELIGAPDPGSTAGRAWQILLHLPSLVRLYWRLFRDERVSVWPKALLVAAVAYVILPFDLIPDTLPVIGEIDDLFVVLVAARWFIQWCPPAVVREHVDAISAQLRG
jgi:uncharacterized membrane protein YkvA (DUF1232 family)